MADLIILREYIDIDGTPLATPAWFTSDLGNLLDSATVAGDDTIMPGTHGARANPRWRRPTQIVIPMYFCGERDRTNAPYANARTGLAANVLAFRAAVVDSPGTSTDLRTLTYHLPSATPSGGHTTMTAQIHVDQLTTTTIGPDWRAGALEINIPGGQLEFS